MTGSHLILRALKMEGIQKIFTIVGDTILPLVDAVPDEGMELIDTRHEAAAMHMGDAWCRVTGEPAVVLVTGGPGFANAMSALPNIFTAESPVIFIAGCAALRDKGKYSFQEIDQVGMAAPVTKGAWVLHERRRIPEFVATAFRTALSGRPGPVHLTIPVDVQEQEISEDELPPYQPREYRNRGRSHGDPSLIKEAIGLLRNANRPVVIAGNTTRYTLPSESLQELIEITGAPLFTLEQARGLVSDDHPLCFGYGDGALNPVSKRFREADVVLLLGKRFDLRFRYGLPPFFSDTASIIQVDPSPTEIGKTRGVSVGIVGDIGAVVEQLTQEANSQGLPSNKLGAWVSQLVEDKGAWEEHLESLMTDDVPLHPMRVVKEVERFIDDDTILIFDGGDYVQWGRSYLKAKKPGHWMRLGPLSHLGCGLPYALAAKLARPDSKVLLFIGDGSFGFYAMEYDTAIRFNLNITTLLGNDSAWGIDKNLQLAYYDRAVGTDLRFVRYDKMVEALGAHGEYVEKASEIGPAVERSLASGKPSLINVKVPTLRSPLADAGIAAKLGAQKAKS